MPTQTSENRNQKPKIQFEQGDFSPFREVENHKLNSRSLVPNPDGTDEIVERFYIDRTQCRGVDCKYGSVRSAVASNIWDDRRPRSVTSPSQAWYSFEIFFPKGTPTYPVDNPNTVLLVEFKEENQCASFALVKITMAVIQILNLTFFFLNILGKRMQDLQVPPANAFHILKQK